MDVGIQDWQLLQDYAATQSQSAFAVLVDKHLNMVYSAALRQVGDRHLAEDVTQAVFLLLARRASQLKPKAPLAAWLLRVTRYASANARKLESRRKYHEARAAGEAKLMTDQADHSSNDIKSLIDGAMARLSRRDSEVLVLRYFQNMSLSDAALALGITSDAVAQRTSRALIRLRKILSAKGASVAAPSVAAWLTHEAVHLAPPTLNAAIISASAGAIPATANLIAAKVATVMIINKIKIAALSLAACALVGLGAIAAIAQLSPRNVIAQSTPATQPAAPATGPDQENLAADLVRQVQQSEAWLDSAKSIHLKVNSRWTRSPQAIANRIAELKRQHPGIEPDVKQFSELAPESSSFIEMAYDDHRIYYLNDRWFGDGTTNLRIWDGSLASTHEKYQTPENFYALSTSPLSYFKPMMSELSWPRAAAHRYWFGDPAEYAGLLTLMGITESYHITGRADYRGVDCYIVKTSIYPRTLYIGVGDHLLHGLKNEVLSLKANAQIQQVMVDLARERGAQVTNGRGYNTWRAQQPPDVQEKLDADYFARVAAFMVPQAEHWMLDYKEVASGCRIPMKMGYDTWFEPRTAGEAYISGTRYMDVLEASVDQPLPDAIFVMPFEDGVEVQDSRQKPLLVYPYKKERSNQEWQTLLEKASQQPNEIQRQDADRHNLINQPAPSLSISRDWINSSPLDWKDLKGKVVIVDFWADWWPASMKDVQTLAAMQKDLADKGIVIVTIHSPVTAADTLRKRVLELGISFPVCVDAAKPTSGGPWGKLMEQFSVTTLPYAYVIDREGKVASHGSLDLVIATAEQLAAAK